MALRSLTQAAMVLVFMFDASWRLTVITFISIPCVILLCQVYGEYLRCAPGAARAPAAAAPCGGAAAGRLLGLGRYCGSWAGRVISSSPSCSPLHLWEQSAPFQESGSRARPPRGAAALGTRRQPSRQPASLRRAP
jgi:hypothetical protein